MGRKMWWAIELPLFGWLLMNKKQSHHSEGGLENVAAESIKKVAGGVRIAGLLSQAGQLGSSDKNCKPWDRWHYMICKSMQMMSQKYSQGYQRKDVSTHHWTTDLWQQEFQPLHHHPVQTTPNLPKIKLDLGLTSGHWRQQLWCTVWAVLVLSEMRLWPKWSLMGRGRSRPFSDELLGLEETQLGDAVVRHPSHRKKPVRMEFLCIK